jgi:hypothetical protein
MTKRLEKSNGSVNAADILAEFAIDRSHADGEREFRYTHRETGRQFTARRLQQTRAKLRFFLCELRPNGRMLEVNERGDITRAWDEPRVEETEARVGPNELRATLQAMDIDMEALAFWSAGHSVDSIYHDSLETCAQCIAQALNENVRYISYRVPKSVTR